MSVVIEATFIKDFASYLDSFPTFTAEAASIAINDTVRDVVLPLARREIMAEANFPIGYVNEDRLYAKSYAKPDHLEAVVEARQRPTSLARFVVGPGMDGKGLEVAVKAGNPKLMQRAFLVKLRRGASISADNFNVGLAIRLRPGEVLQNKRELNAVQLDDNVYILYGPSVDQIFRSVAEDITPEVSRQLTLEFIRQLNVRIGNR